VTGHVWWSREAFGLLGSSITLILAGVLAPKPPSPYYSLDMPLTEIGRVLGISPPTSACICIWRERAFERYWRRPNDRHKALD
jgi:hypothetical protein